MTLCAGLVVFGVVIIFSPWQVAVLTGWIAAAIVFMAWVWVAVARLDSAATAKLARVDDHASSAAHSILIAASAASLVIAAFALVKAGEEEGSAKLLTTAVAAISIVLAWATVHTVFTLRYATLYYIEEVGIIFNEDRQPDYGDFAYFAFTIGMTYQVSDTLLTRRPIRMTVLRHALLSFVFGTGVLAMTINVVAQLFN